MILLRRPVRVGQEIKRRLRRAVEIDAAAVHLLERSTDAHVARPWTLRCAFCPQSGGAMTGKFLPFKYYGATGNSQAYGFKEE